MSRSPRPPWALLASALSLLLLPACEDYLFEQVCPEGIKEVARTVPELEPTPADILFVVDNSGSMREEQENLAANFTAFIDALADSGGDYQLAIVTTDATGQNPCGQPGQECGGFRTFEFGEMYPFPLQTQNVDACFQVPIPSGCFRTDDDGLAIISSDLGASTIVESFQQAVQVGTCGNGIEAGLQTMRQALDRAESGCNQGFLRPEANLVVVFVSDERGNSISNDDKADGIQPSELQPFIDALVDAKGGDISKVRVASIVGAVDGEARDCRTDASPAEDDPPTAQCGSFCEEIPATLGSETPCPNGPSDCPAGADEVCRNGGLYDGLCVGREYLNYIAGLEANPPEPRRCASCTYYATEDCCIAEPGDEYVAFARAFGTQASGQSSTCQPGDGGRTFCLVDSICQENFSVTLDRIARELVAASTFTLDPAADFPEGVVVNIIGTDGAVRTLENGTDFTVSADGRTFEFLGGAGPAEGESLELFYTTERTVDRPLRGACVTSTSAS